MYWSTIQTNRQTSTLRSIILRRFESPRFFNLSPIERWSDANYAPEPLEYIWVKTPDTYKIIAPLYGFEPQDVHVDLCREVVIILISQDYDAVFGQQEEFYCEIPIPAGLKRNQALVEVDDRFVTVTLSKKPESLVKCIAQEVARFRQGFSVSPRKVQTLH